MTWKFNWTEMQLKLMWGVQQISKSVYFANLYVWTQGELQRPNNFSQTNFHLDMQWNAGSVEPGSLSKLMCTVKKAPEFAMLG